MFIRLRFFICLVCAAAAAVLSCASASPAAGPRIILLETMPVPLVAEYEVQVRKALANAGYTDGKTADIELIKAEGSRDRAIRLLNAARAEGEPNLVVAFATVAAQAAYEVFRYTSVPVLFCAVSDPVGSGLVPVLGKPSGTNITGRAHSIPRKTKLDTALRLADQIRNKLHPDGSPLKFGLVATDYPSSAGDIARLEMAAERRGGVRFISRFIPYRDMPEHFDSILDLAEAEVRRLAPSIDFWWQQTGPLAEMPAFTKMMLEAGRKPVIYGNSLDSVRRGALLTMIPDIRAEGKIIADTVVNVLKGENPADIPVVRTDRMIVGVNIGAARRLGIIIPPDILKKAGKNVFQ